jgi:hypothetical protein
VNHLNQVYSSLSVRRRYEVWFIRFGLADGSGAWWLRYLLMNPGRSGCAGNPLGMPVQVWATWFPRDGKPQSFIQGFPLNELQLSPKGQSPFHYAIADNVIEENSCRGRLQVDGHNLSWELLYGSTFQVTLSSKGWIGFSRTPHSDAVFSGHILLDGRKFEGQPLGFGLQGHNCGYRHRSCWTWAHAYFPHPDSRPSTFEALVYDMPLGLFFRKGVLWHEGKQYVFRKLREITEDRTNLQWNFQASAADGSQLEVAIDGRGPALHRLPYLKTDCSGSFEVVNNSLASTTLRLVRQGRPAEKLQTTGGAVLEMGGQGWLASRVHHAARLRTAPAGS